MPTNIYIVYTSDKLKEIYFEKGKAVYWLYVWFFLPLTLRERNLLACREQVPTLTKPIDTGS